MKKFAVSHERKEITMIAISILTLTMYLLGFLFLELVHLIP
jgi:hypothetical protein